MNEQLDMRKKFSEVSQLAALVTSARNLLDHLKFIPDGHQDCGEMLQLALKPYEEEQQRAMREMEQATADARQEAMANR